MYISLSYDLHFLSSISDGNFNKNYCGGPYNWFIHKHNDPDFIQLLMNDKIKITKPIITIPYNFESYLYVFFLYDTNSKIPKFIPENHEVYKIDDLCFAILTDNQILNYDHKNERMIDKNGEQIDPDDVGGYITYSELYQI